MALYASATAMILEIERDVMLRKPIRVPVAVDALVMMANDRGDPVIRHDLGENPSPISECFCITRRSSSVSGPSSQADPAGNPILPMSCTSPARCALCCPLREAHSRCDVSRVDCHGRGVASGVAISGVKRRHERGREREVCLARGFIRRRQVLSQAALLLIHREEPLCCERRVRNSGSVHGDTSW